MEYDDVLHVSGLSGVISYEPEELLLTVLPGTSILEINELLAANNQRLGFEPADWGPLFGGQKNRATIGGVISADTCGSASVRYGRVRDHLLGFRAVNGFGEAYKGGGKVVKNVTGFDLPKLMCGSMGTLGVLTEVTLRVFPRPSLSKVFAVRASRSDGLALLQRVWSSPLEATRLTCSDAISFIRLEGEAEPLAEKIAMLREIVAPHLVLDSDEDGDVFRDLASGRMFFGPSSDVWRLSLPASRSAFCSRLDSPFVSEWAGGLHWVSATSGVSVEDLQRSLGRSEARFTLVRASEATRGRAQVFPAESAARAALTRAVKDAFDPLGLFNPGRMYEGV
jgi:glycolate oxidase FAD binding subunit